MHRVLFLVCAFLLSCFKGETAMAEEHETVLATVHFPPYIIDNGTTLSGYDVDVVREAFHRIKEPLRIIIVPWRRALTMAKQGLITGILTCSPRQVFTSSDPISTATDALFLNADHDFKAYPVSSIQDLTKYPELKIGGVAGYRQLKLLDNANLNYDISPEDKTAFKKLFAGRINVFLSIQEFGEYTLRQLKLSHLVKTIPLRAKKYHICFSKSHPRADKIRQRFNWAMATMHHDGTYQAIHDRYK